MKLPDQVTIYEVGLRDGLQLESKVLTVDEKVEIFSLLQKANVSEIEFGSFVHPKLVPQMANTAAFHEHLKSYPELSLIALVPNLKGLELAKQTGVKSVNYVFSASNTHNEQNVRQTTEQSLKNFKHLSQFASDNEINLNVTVATSFGCPFEGPVPRQRIMNLIEQLLLHNIKRITLADTTGMANPKQVYQLTKEVVNEWKNVEFGCHFHNTRGMGLANILAGLEAGITVFDASLGGIGGCPFAPGATGNVCTEDVVHMLEEMGENWRQRAKPYEVGRDVVVPFLKGKGITKIDKLILTHGDMDHIGGANSIIKELKVEEILLPSVAEPSAMEEEIKAEAEKKGINIVHVSSGYRWGNADHQFYILSPDKNFKGERNSGSLAIFARFGGLAWFFGGDLDKLGEERIIQRYPELTVDVLKAGHHGSKTSSSEAFLLQIKPKAAFISVGEENRFGHPHQEVIKLLNEVNAVIYRTDLQGAITYSFYRNRGTFSTFLP